MRTAFVLIVATLLLALAGCQKEIKEVRHRLEPSQVQGSQFSVES